MSCETPSIRTSISANGQFVQLPVGGLGSLGIDVRGTFVGTLTFQASINGEDWIALPVLPIGTTTNAALVTTTTGVGAWLGAVAGISQVRVTFTAYTSGAAIITIRAEDDPSIVYNLSNGAAAGQTIGSIAAGTNAIGDVGIQYRASNTGAASVVSVLSPATPAAATIKASAGRLLGWQLQNSSAAIRSVKIFNATAPTLGTTAAIFEIDIPAGGAVSFEADGGIGFATAMTYSVTSAKGLIDNTATGLAANDVSGSFFFA